MEGNARKSKKKYYAQSKKTKYDNALGTKGILVTCNSHEDRCVREMYNLLNEYVDKLFPEGLPKEEEETQEPTETPVEAVVKKEEPLSIEKQLEQELETIKTVSSKKKHIFQSVSTGCKGVVYISIRHDKIEPVQFVKSILQDLESTKTQKTRFCSRFVPIQKTCAANIQEIEKTAKPLIEQVFNSTPSNIGKKFAIIYGCRNNNSCKKTEITEKVFNLVKTPLNWVDLKNPDWVIIIEIIKKVCCISIANDYTKLRKYNIRQVSMSEELRNAHNEHKEAMKEEKDKEEDNEEKQEEVEEEEEEEDVVNIVKKEEQQQQQQEEEEDISLFGNKNKRKENTTTSSSSTSENKKIKSDA